MIINGGNAKKMVTAIVMAGGKGTRMGGIIEKPLIKVEGKPMIQYVMNALNNSNNIGNIIILTSPHTPKTTKFVQKMGFEVFQTSGKGYIEDLRSFIFEQYPNDSNHVLLTITADMPLIKPETIDHVLLKYRMSDKPAMCIAVPLNIFQENGLKPSMVMGNTVPSGLNILRSNNKQQDEEVLELGKIELAININSCEDIVILEEIKINWDKNLGDTNGC